MDQFQGVTEEPGTDGSVVSVDMGEEPDAEALGPPGEGESVNLIMQIPEADRGALGQQCWDRWDRASRSRETHMERSKRWLELYALVRKEKNWPFRNCANVTTPLLAAAVLHTHATLYDMMVPGEGQLYSSKPTTPGDEEMRRANVTELVMNHYIRSDIPNYEIGLDDSLWQLILFGSMFRRIVWSERDGAILADSVSLDDMVVPYKCKVLDPMMRGINGYTWVQYLEPDELEERIDDGFYENTDRVSLTPGYIDRSSFRQGADEIAGVEPPFDDEDGTIQIFDHHFRMRMPEGVAGGGWHHVTATVDERTKTVMRLILRERADPKTGKVREVPNFVHYKGFPSEGYYGLGFGDFVGPLNDAQNAVLNQFIDAMTLQNAGGGFVSSTMKSQKGEIVLQPGVYQPINAPASAIRDGIYHHEFRPPNNVALEVTDKITEMSNRVTVQSEVLSGETSGSDRQTATEVKIRTEMVLKQVSVFMRRTKNSQKAEGRIIWDLLGLNLDEKEAMNVVNNDNEPVQVKVSRSDFIPDANVQPVADPTITSRHQRIEQATNLYAILKQDPLTMNNPAIAYAAISDVLTAYGDYSKRRMLGPPPQADKPSPPMPQSDENYAMSMGKAMPIHDEDDHDQHLVELERYEKTPAFAATAPDAKALIHHHTAQHLAAQERVKQERLREQKPLLRLVGGGPSQLAQPPGDGGVPGPASPVPGGEDGGGDRPQPPRRAGKGRSRRGGGKRDRPGDRNA